MTMTEQEIRADEREKIAKDIECLPGRFAEVPQPACAMVARYIRAERPGGWRAWSGQYEPAAGRNLTVEIERRNGDRSINKVRAFAGWRWRGFDPDRDIIRWRLPVAKPKPKMEPAPPTWSITWPWMFAHTVKVPPANPKPDAGAGYVKMSPDSWPGGPEDQPPKDWRDVPVTAGVLADACEAIGDHAFNTVCDLVEFAARKAVAP